MLVAGILVVLIVILGVLYYIILKQSAPTPTPKVVVPTPTVTAPTPTVTPTDEELLNTEVPNPATDQADLESETQGL